MEKTAALLFIATLTTLFTGCGENPDTEVQYDPPEEKMLFHDTKTVGCWMRFRVDVNGSTEKLPWSAFLLTKDERYYQADTFDRGNTRYVIADKGLNARWNQERYDKIDVYADYDKNGTWVSEHMEIFVTDFYAKPAHSFQTHTFNHIKIENNETNTTDYRDVIMREENYRLINDTEEVPTICQILYDEAGI